MCTSIGFKYKEGIVFGRTLEIGREMDNKILYVPAGKEDFIDAKGDKVVLEPKDGKLIQYDNPYGVLTNSPEFHWHQTNLKNYINLKSENIEEGEFNGFNISKLGEGTGMLGIPGDFTPASRFVRSAYFVSIHLKI